MKKILATLFILLIGFGTAGYIYYHNKEYTVRIAEFDIQQQLNEQMPVSNTYLFLFKVTIFNPRVDFVKDTGRIMAGLDVNIDVKLEGIKPMYGTVNASGVLKYVPSEGAFYLKSPRIEQLFLSSVSDEKMNQARKFIEKTLANYLDKYPVYKLKSTSIGDLATRMIMKNVKVEDTEIIATMGL